MKRLKRKGESEMTCEVGQQHSMCRGLCHRHLVCFRDGDGDIEAKE